MCLSPHEMTADQVALRIAEIEDRLARPTLVGHQRQTWQWRLAGFQAMLREYREREAAQAELERQVQVARAAVAEAEQLAARASTGVYQLAA